MAVIPDVPADIELQQARTSFLVSKVIDRVADDGFDEEKVSEDHAPRRRTIVINPHPNESRLR